MHHEEPCMYYPHFESGHLIPVSSDCEHAPWHQYVSSYLQHVIVVLQLTSPCPPFFPLTTHVCILLQRRLDEQERLMTEPIKEESSIQVDRACRASAPPISIYI